MRPSRFLAAAAGAGLGGLLAAALLVPPADAESPYDRLPDNMKKGVSARDLLYKNQPEKQAELEKQRAEEAEVDIPSKWFRGYDGYLEAAAIQKQNGADIFLYFLEPTTKSEKGLNAWFQKWGIKSHEVNKLLRRHYIQVRVELPGTKEDRAFADDFYIGTTPTVYIIQSNGWKNMCKVFDWPGGEPELKDPEDLVRLFVSKSSKRVKELYKDY